VRLQLNDCGATFPAGHRIRLALSTTYWPMVWPAPHDATVLDNGDSDRASAVAAVVGGLEVNGGERGH
jgi:predicted acyl esterase